MKCGHFFFPHALNKRSTDEGPHRTSGTKTGEAPTRGAKRIRCFDGSGLATSPRLRDHSEDKYLSGVWTLLVEIRVLR
jgi:hypothetical protein